MKDTHQLIASKIKILMTKKSGEERLMMAAIVTGAVVGITSAKASVGLMVGVPLVWCEDLYDENYGLTDGGIEDGVKDPLNNRTGSFPVIRGGGWCDIPRYLRSANRHGDWSGDRAFGFRLVRQK